jgi:thiol-disulfide isomerase/thioredoxin
MSFARSQLPLFVLLAASTSLAGVGCSSTSTPAPAGEPGPSEPAADATPTEDAPPVELPYPEGPYGLEGQKVFPPIKFKAYREGTGEFTEIDMREYYDPDGTKGIYALGVLVIAEWCTYCRHEAPQLPRLFAEKYKPRGAKFVQILVQDKDGEPADQTTADRWVRSFKPTFDFGIDPEERSVERKVVQGRETLLFPTSYAINTRDMKIFKVQAGSVPIDVKLESIAGLTTVLNRNGAPPAPQQDAGAPDATPDATPADTAPAETGPADAGPADAEPETGEDAG